MKYFTNLIIPFLLWTNLHAQTARTNLVLRGELQPQILKIVASYDGGFIVAGAVGKTTSLNQRDLLIAKYDHNFNLVWRKVYGTKKDEIAYHMMETNAHEIVIAYSTCDSFAKPNGNFAAMHLLKLDASGNKLWVKSFYHNKYCTSIIRGIHEAQNHNYVVITEQDQVNGFGAPVGVLITDTTGAVVNNTLIRNASSIDFAKSVKYGNGYALLGSDDVISISKNSLMYTHCDALGKVLHSKRYGSNDDINLTSICPMPDGNLLLLAGYNYKASFMMKIDSTGSLLWSKLYANADTGFSTAITSNGKTYLFGYCYPGGSSNPLQSMTAEIDNAGNFVWSKLSKAPCNATTAVVESSGNTAVFSGFYYSAPYPGVLMRTVLSSSLSCEERAITLTSRNYGLIANITGTTNDTVKTFPVQIPLLISVAASGNVSDSLLCGNPADIKDSRIHGRYFSVYPNPLTLGEDLHVKSDYTENAVVEIFDALGRKYFSKKMNQGVIHTKGLLPSAGAYYIRMSLSDMETISQHILITE